MLINAYAVREPNGALERFSYEAAPLGPNDVEIRVTHCGICYSDVHLIQNDWGVTSFPLVPGHEIVGIVSALGEAVTHLKCGNRVGVGWQRSSCLVCEKCMSGNENYCPQDQATCLGNYGGFADMIRCDSRFVFALPDALSSECAAPLMCAGITVYAPLREYGVDASKRVGVIGVGGLGHLAIQFASAMGCEVTAFSRSPSKEEECRSLGAAHYVATDEPGGLARMADSLDFIINTSFGTFPADAYIKILRSGGSLCMLARPPEPISVSVFPLMLGRKSVCGSATGGRAMIREMLGFAARHRIETRTEVQSMSQANEAIEKIRRHEVRYRMVLRN
jgi:alcohol/geraniol dehydrogenase (NADP+)